MTKKAIILSGLTILMTFPGVFTVNGAQLEKVGTCPAEGSLITEDRSPFSMAVVVPKFKSAEIMPKKEGIVCEYQGVKIKMRVAFTYVFETCNFDNTPGKLKCEGGDCLIYCLRKE